MTTNPLLYTITNTWWYRSNYWIGQSFTSGWADYLLPKWSCHLYLKDLRDLFQEAMSLLQEGLEQYENRLKEASSGVPENKEDETVPRARENIGRFLHWFENESYLSELLLRVQKEFPEFAFDYDLLRRVKEAHHLMVIQGAIQREGPIEAIAKFLRNEADKEDVEAIKLFSRRLFLTETFRPPLLSMVVGVRYLALQILGVNREWPLFSLMDEGSEGALRRLVDEINDPDFLEKRRRILAEKKVTVDGEEIILGKRLSEAAPLSAPHLTFEVKDDSTILRIGRHPLSLALEHGANGSLVTRLRPTWIKEGMALYPKLALLNNISDWTDQRLKRVNSLLEWMMDQKKKIPTKKDLSKIGFDQEGRLWSVSTTYEEDFNLKSLECLVKEMTGENIEDFRKFIEPWKDRMFDTVLRRELDVWVEEFLDLGRLPLPKKDMSKEFMEEVDRQTAVYNALLERGYASREIARALYAWRCHVGMMQSKWKREKEDLVLLIGAKRKGDPSHLPSELTGAYNRLSDSRD